jgi:Flp pilus assembly pilin Flp
MGKVRDIEFSLVDALVTFVVVTSGVTLFQLVRSRFDPASSLFISLLICGVAGLIFVRRVVLPVNKRHVIAATLMGLFVLMFRWSPFLYVEGGQDQGVYVSMSAHFARTQGLPVTDQVRERLSDTEKTEYDKLNNHHDGERVEVPGRSEGEHQPGIFIADLSRSAYVFQFYPLHPLWMALAAKVLGEDNRVYSLVGFSLLSVLMLSLLAYELADRKPAPAFLAAGLLAINPMHVFLSRFPVTENVTVFFSASAFYYLLRYFRAREAGHGQTWNLVLSAGAWACLFFNHIAGFLYAPLILAAIVAGVVSARTVDRMLEMVGYGLALVAAYALSLWYGMTWAFPYSYGTYRGVFGTGLGTFFVNHWKWVIFVLAVMGCGLVFLAWRFRARIRSEWTKLRLDQVLMGILLVAAIGTVVYATAEGYRLGFTADYSLQADPRDSRSTAFAAAGENWRHRASQLSNTGAAGFLHSSVVALAIYVSPFILVFALATCVVKRRRIGLYEIFLVMLVTQFLVIRTGMESLTLYYYYGRYLGAELVPYILVLAALWLYRLLKDAGWPGKVAAGATLGLALAWEGVALAQQYPGGEMHRLDASMRPLVEQIRADDLLVLAGGEYPALRTALDYYYGKHTVVVEPSQVPAAVRRYSNLWADLYVLSDKDNLAGLSYLGALTLVRDAYAKGGYYDVLPARSTAVEKRYYLYRVSRPVLTVLQVGDTITFDRRGNGRNLLGAGWSDQEDGGRWTDGETASLILPFSDRSSALNLGFDVRSFNCVDVTVRVNGAVRTKWSFLDCAGFSSKAIVLSQEDLKPGTVTVSFEMPGVTSPHDKDPALGDRRKLGIWINKFVVNKANPGEGGVANMVGRPPK